MSRWFGFALLILPMVSQTADAQALEGTWRNNTPGTGGVSYWEITAKEKGAYKAVEVGLGNVEGTARLKEGNILVIQWEGKDGTVKSYYEWHLKGTSGAGKLVFTQYPAEFNLGVERERDGKKVREIDESTVRFIGR